MKTISRKSVLLGLLILVLAGATAQLIIYPVFLKKLPPPGDGSYANYWLQVDSLQNLGLTQEANDVVKKISVKAEKEKNSVQLIKAFFYNSRYRDILEEGSEDLNMANLDKMISESGGAVKHLLYSIKGELIWYRYTSNMWQIAQRTPIQDDKETDMEKWDSHHFALESMKYYQLSVSDPAVLQHTDLSFYRELLAGDSTSRDLRPTLYDLLVHRAIVFYSNPYLSMLEPAEKFELDQPIYFGLSDDFIKLKFEAKDSASSLLHAIKLYQDLYHFHSADRTSDALVQLELERLEFIHSKSILDTKDSVYLESLKNLVTRYDGKPVVAGIYFELAKAYSAQSDNWTADSDEQYFRQYRKESLRLCNFVLEKYAGTDAANNCTLLKRELQVPSVNLSLRKGQVSKSNILVSANYRNIKKVYVKVYLHDYDKNGNALIYYSSQDEGYSLAKSGKLMKEYSFDLKSFDDMFDHQTEFKIDPLEYGFYSLTFSTEQNDGDSLSFNGFTTFWSTDLTVNSMENYTGGLKIFNVINRYSGMPVPNANVGVYRYKYNYNASRYENERVKSVLSDKYGMIKDTYKNGESYFFDIRNGKDRYVTEQFYYYSYDYKEKASKDVRFYLDRGLYRPGQTVQFKLISLKNDTKTFSALAKDKITVTMYDINYKVISTLDVVTNDFGTASGSFVIPASVATGQWRLSTENGSMGFQVEEYKRPKFEVNIDSIPGTPALNEQVVVRGSAKALSGYGITDADVTYKVDRVTQMYIYDYSYYRRNTGSKTISTGKMKTNDKGEFEFTFTALPDLQVKQKYQPYFVYTVTVDVTDLSGETRSSSFSVIVGQKTLNISCGIPYYLDKADTNSYLFYASNLTGFDVFTKGTYEIKKLKAPDSYSVPRPFQKPDEPLMDEKSFGQYFPHIPYEKEPTVADYEKGETVLTGSFDTEQKTEVTPSVWNKLPQGWYCVLTKAKDSQGQEVTAENYFMLYDTKERAYPFQQFATCIPIKTSCKPGEKAEILLGSSVDQGVFTLIHEFEGRIIKHETITVNKEQKLVSFPICADKNNAYTVHIFMVNNDHVFNVSEYFYTEDRSDVIEMDLVTFRDKMIPGANEEWKLKLKDYRGLPLAGAEVLANMYDASLDELSYPNTWDNYFGMYNSSGYYLNMNEFSNTSNAYGSRKWYEEYLYYRYKSFEQLNYFGWLNSYNTYRYDGDNYYMWDDEKAMDGFSLKDNKQMLRLEESITVVNDVNAEVTNGTFATGNVGGLLPVTSQTKNTNMPNPVEKVRTNFNETAFFYPHLQSDANGEVLVSFKLPESLTKWKFRAMAITKDLRSTYVEKFAVAQKQIMITSFAPRFVREGDKIYFSAKVTNLSDKELKAVAELKLRDGILDSDLHLAATETAQSVTVKAGESQKVQWSFQIPSGIQALTYTLTAKANEHTDGEQNTIPVLSNRMLVTESVPLNVRGDSSKTYTFVNLVNSGNSNSLKNERLTVEITANPAWYTIQALPYMMEYPYECAEQTFNRYYANAIGAYIANSDPKINKVFEVWKNYQPDALRSNLEKNEELKNILIEETPWLRDAKDETERKRRLGVLFDLNRMNNEAERTINKLADMQVSNGAWPWFEGGPENRYITQYIVSGMGHLKKLGVDPNNSKLNQMMVNAIEFLDGEIKEDYDELVRLKVNLTLDNISEYHIQYLYARSFFKEVPVKDKYKTAYDYFYKQAETYWLSKSIYMQGMIALVHSRSGNTTFAQSVVKSLKQNAVHSDEMGMYWKQTSGWYWYQAPIEAQALLIEAFDEVSNDHASVEEMKIWLLKNKQTNDWKTTKATADACYALLLKGTNLLAQEPEITVNLGNKTISSTDKNLVKEAGTGYFKTTVSASDITPDMGNIKISKKGSGISWGAVYWQYFEDMDKIPSSINNLQVTKRLFKQVYTKTGNTLQAITETSPLVIGDKVTVRLELKVDRDMEFVHIKDMRASTLEPVNVISMYKYREGLWYYQSTRDVATHFFIEFMPKGSYVFEYNVRVTHAGQFSNGITTIQCMYAPEFTSHTKGITINVAE